MKTIKFFKSLTAMAAVLALASCSSDQDVAPVKDTETTAVPLSVSVAGIESSSRAIIESPTLPIGSEFSLRAYEGYNSLMPGAGNVGAVVEADTVILNKQILIPTDGLRVTALYPYQPEFIDDLYVSIRAFAGVTDYLWGEGQYRAMITEPKVPIIFNHVLARITLRFTTTPDNVASYEFNRARLTRGNDELKQCYDYAMLDMSSGQLIEKQWYDEGIPGQLSSDYLNRNTKPLLIDFLVIPGATDYYVELDSSVFVDGFNLPMADYGQGVQYIYNVQISDGNKLVISDCQIIPWENTEMPDINIVE